MQPEPGLLRIVTLGEFVAVEEPGAEALVGADGESALIPEGGDVMLFGDGGAGKTTLAVDLACHLAAGDEWLDVPIARAVNVLLIESEGPRPHFRTKLRRKRSAWKGSLIGSRIRVLETPWAVLTLADELHREALAASIRELAIDVVVLGPVTRSGMNAAGTLQETRDFMAHVADVRLRAERTVAFVLIHHENKGGQVSGAWEGAVDTLLHIQGQGHGRTRMFIQKARWSSSHHATAMQLAWADGDGFEVAEAERDDDTIADEILEAVRSNGGTAWTPIQKSIPGKTERLIAIRDRLLAGGRLVNAGTETRTKLWHVDDPALNVSLPGWEDSGKTPHSAPGSEADESSLPVFPPIREDSGKEDSLDSPVATGEAA